MSEDPPREESADADTDRLAVGQTLYTDAGEPVGTVRGIAEDGAFVTTRDGLEEFSVEHVRSGHGFGEAELMWRCIECGEMGSLADGLPDRCPNCGVPKESLMYWTED